jgi:acyl-CoA dehydrogenase
VTSTALVEFVLEAPCELGDARTLETFWVEAVRAASGFKHPIDIAIARALSADRIGFAFAAGYHGALRALVPELPQDRIVGFCATETGGAHPRAIATRLELSSDGSGALNGKKRWSTLAPRAAELLIVASTGSDDAGRNRLRVVHVAATARGITMREMPATPFAPEIPHAELSLEDVAVDAGQVLPGDGYEEYLRPFRTIEDIYVHGALFGYLAGVARRFAWPSDALERIVAELIGVRALAFEPVSAPELHVALAGRLTSGRDLIDRLEAHWGGVEPAERERWQRDRGLSEVAGRAREARLKRAWERITEKSRARCKR